VPSLRPAWFYGAPKIKSKIKSGSLRIVGTLFCRRRIAGEKRAGIAFCLVFYEFK